ncbi:FtsW/RodA/SpoVE family cell cycle protein [filamentous cyanobacterium LEGE 11480]|uniref:Probable peptidoglycan glycosyltransferase FtsW n=1 Tax=Romeriopsis navalis LEGE 11480 TaxID=2777977 RepID=A0A928VNY3_9CYAN|nr:FtsW/RodA/SpoVE family cell cycle protein [Romeriopsis navalis]MBE9031092.1 FtsW/RodA/SpoVE family cell cycle protein [Romeriopsis navalis LEGE 11480]
MKLNQFIPFFDTTARDWSTEARFLRWLTFVWLMLGFMVMCSASFPAGIQEFNNGWHYPIRQTINLVIGMVFFNIIVHSPLKRMLNIAHWGVLIFLALIFATRLPGVGTSVNGAARWIPIGPFLLQPSEFIKPFLVLQSARIFGQWDNLTWRTRLTWLGIFCVVLFAILLQPNLSTTALCGITIWLIALAAGLPMYYMSMTAGGGLLLATISITFREYQRKRVMSFLNPWNDAQGDGYQLTQSLMAVGSGKLLGSGFGQSQQKMGFLPIQYTDFIYAIFAEEFGLIGGIFLLTLMIAYASLALWISTKAKTNIYRLIAIGIMVLIVGQAMLNIGVATGALPTTGLPFPMWSYGGSSLWSSLISAAILIRVARENTEAEIVDMGDRSPRRQRVLDFPGRKARRR